MKTKAKSALNALIELTEDSPTYKRERMKEVRSMVAAAIKHNLRVDQMEFTGSDIARSQIALQDLLEKEKEKHAKAREHIVTQKKMINIFSDVIQAMGEHVLRVTEKSKNDINALTKDVENYREQRDHFRDAWIKANSEKQVLQSMLKDSL